jgi:AraC-like DNA-binding protein
MRLVRPFLRVLRCSEGFPPALIDPLETLDPDERLPIATVHELLDGALAITGDTDIGLKAAREISPGDYGALEYMASSAATWGESIALIGRYMPLVNDALEFTLRIDGERAVVQLDSKVVLPRASADYQSGAFHVAASYRMPPGVVVESEVWFTHPKPARIEEYQLTFGPSRVLFDAPFNGFVFDKRYLDEKQPAAEPKLHALLRKHADLLLAELPKAESLTERVREVIAKELSGGNPSAEGVARALHMSSRTLSRKLEQEGVSLTELRDDMRRRLALRYVGGHDLGLSEIALLLGFSESAAFHRAFKRWTGQTPLEYRRSKRG